MFKASAQLSAEQAKRDAVLAFRQEIGVELTKLLIDAGADINQPDAKNRMAIQHLISQPKLTDEALASLYDIIFQSCALELNTKNDWGYTPIELALKFPYRAELLKRMTA